MKKLITLLILSCSLLFGAIDLQTATKEELMTIKGIGEIKAEQIIEYRKTNSINYPEDLKNIKGFGDSIVENIKQDIKVKKTSKSSKADNLEKK